jgi:proline iminopeptidase
MREAFVKVPGGKVFHRTVGEDAPGIPLLVLHGGPGIPHDYLEPLEALGRERPVVFYDQLGCGASDRPDDLSLYTLPRFVEELAVVRGELGLGRMHLLGQSWGAMLAVEYYLESRQQGIASLVLSGPCLDSRRFAADQRVHLAHMPKPVQAAIQKAEATGDFEAAAYQEAIGAYYAKHVCLLDPWPECLNRAIEKMNMAVYGHMWGPSEFTCTGTLKDHGRRDELGSIRVPVLFTCGAQDEATPATVADYQALVPGAELRVFENASHSHHLEQPEAYLTTVSDFLRRVESGQSATQS